MWGRHKKNKPEALVKGLERLVSLPEVLASAKEKLNDPAVDADALGRIIRQDADLTARLLRLANSASYGLTSKVETVGRAVAVVGLRQVEALVLTSAAVETFARLPTEHINMAAFWRHSLFTAVLSRILARERYVLHAERLFVAGLLHDVGSLVLYHHAPELAQKVVGQSDALEDHALEQETLGFDHAEVGGALAELWNLPPGLHEAVACHHSPEEAGDFVLEASIVHVADMMARAMELKEDEGLRQVCEATAWQMAGVEESRINPIFQEALREFIDVLDLLQPGLARPGRKS